MKSKVNILTQLSSRQGVYISKFIFLIGFYNWIDLEIYIKHMNFTPNKKKKAYLIPRGLKDGAIATGKKKKRIKVA